MKSLKWIFCALAVSAGAYFSIDSSKSIICDNIEALTSGDPKDKSNEVDCFFQAEWSEMPGYVRLVETGNCLYYPYTFSAENNPKCIMVNP